MVEGTEMSLMGALRTHFEGRGYEFFEVPEPATLPAFLKGFRPDAIAKRLGDNVVIEIKSRKTRESELQLQALRNRLEPGWSLNVIYAAGADAEDQAIPAASLDQFERERTAIISLLDIGQTRAAFVLSWSLLEATLSRLGDISAVKSTGQVIQFIAMRGLVNKEEEKNLRQKMQLRNRIVHGDLNAKPETDDVVSVLTVVERVLQSE